MFFWILLFFLIFILYLKNDKKWLLITFLYLYLLVAFRNQYMGLYDTWMVYLPAFRDMEKRSFEWVLQTHSDKDPFFYILTWIYHIFSDYEQLYLAICAFPLFIATYFFIKRYSKLYSVSVVLFLTVNQFSLSFYGIRHCLALAFVTYVISNHKKMSLKKQYIYLIISSLFHISAVIAFFIPLLKYIRIKPLFMFCGIICSSFIFFFLKSKIIPLLVSIYINNESFSRFSVYTEDSNTALNLYFTIIVSILLFFTLPKRKDTKALEKQKVFYTNLSFVGVVLSSGVLIFGEFLRLSSFYLVPLMVLVPNQIYTNYSYRNRRIVALCFSCFIYLYFIFSICANSNILNYKTFFMEIPSKEILK